MLRHTQTHLQPSFNAKQYRIALCGFMSKRNNDRTEVGVDKCREMSLCNTFVEWQMQNLEFVSTRKCIHQLKQVFPTT